MEAGRALVAATFDALLGADAGQALATACLCIVVCLVNVARAVSVELIYLLSRQIHLTKVQAINRFTYVCFSHARCQNKSELVDPY